MSFLNGNNIVYGNIVLPRYQWVQMASGTVEDEPIDKITADTVNERHVRLYGAAVKYQAPKRSDVATDFAAFLQLGVAAYNSGGRMIRFDVPLYIQIPSATSGGNARYGCAVLDGSQGMYQGKWYTNSGTPYEGYDMGVPRAAAYRFQFHPTDAEECNAIRFLSYRQPNGTGMFEPGTSYEIWGLVKMTGEDQ